LLTYHACAILPLISLLALSPLSLDPAPPAVPRAQQERVLALLLAPLLAEEVEKEEKEEEEMELEAQCQKSNQVTFRKSRPQIEGCIHSPNEEASKMQRSTHSPAPFIISTLSVTDKLQCRVFERFLQVHRPSSGEGMTMQFQQERLARCRCYRPCRRFTPLMATAAGSGCKMVRRMLR